jgi:hypothetical protein
MIVCRSKIDRSRGVAVLLETPFASMSGLITRFGSRGAANTLTFRSTCAPLIARAGLSGE